MELHMATQATVTEHYNSMMKTQLVMIQLPIATGVLLGVILIVMLLETPQICMILYLYNQTSIILDIVITRELLVIAP